MAATSPPDEDDGVMREVAEQWPKLSKATRRALAPDLAPPPLREGKPKEKKQGKARASDDGIQGDCVLGGYSAPLEERHRRRRRGRINWDPKHPEDARSVSQLGGGRHHRLRPLQADHGPRAAQ